MRKLFGLLAGLSFSVALVGCEKPAEKKIDKAAKEEKQENADEVKDFDKALDKDAKAAKDEAKDMEKAADADIDADAARAKKDAAEDDTDK